MINLIPAQYRIAAAIVAVLALCGASAAGGAVVATWKATAEHAGALRQSADEASKLREEKHQLEAAVAEQNKAVAVAEAQTVAANAARLNAERHAADLAVFSKSRLEKLAASFSNATSCDDVLKGYWELRK